MCWAVPAKVVAIVSDVVAEVDLGGGTIKRVAIGVDNVKPGDYVMVHAGVIIEKLTREGVIENLKFIAEEIRRTEEIMGKSEEEARRAADEFFREALKILEG